jgi:anhydro-N-acetylmuramic acid kinase
MKVYLGVMSGTSLDGIDVVACQFDPFKLVATHSGDFPLDLKEVLKDLCQPGDNEITRLAAASFDYTLRVAQVVGELLAKLSTDQNVCCIGFHGQTLRHLPHLGFSLQLGDPALLSELCQLPVAAQFRQSDLAAGGQGAPLVPPFHATLFGTDTPRVILNLGGIANITALVPGQPVLGFDTGPANLLMDAWCLRHTGKAYDDGGAWAATGSVISPLLTDLLSEPYFRAPAPKSTGRELFNPNWLEQFDLQGYAPADVQRTLLELTAVSVCDAIAALNLIEAEVFVCGGGAYNSVLMERMAKLLPEFTWQSTQVLGLAPTWVEAAAFAWLSFQRVEQNAANEPAVTGAKAYRVLGGLYDGRVKHN